MNIENTQRMGSGMLRQFMAGNESESRNRSRVSSEDGERGAAENLNEIKLEEY
jgi:hypothetical protein